LQVEATTWQQKSNIKQQVCFILARKEQVNKRTHPTPIRVGCREKAVYFLVFFKKSLKKLKKEVIL
jgi:hypothetical protein